MRREARRDSYRFGFVSVARFVTHAEIVAERKIVAALRRKGWGLHFASPEHDCIYLVLPSEERGWGQPLSTREGDQGGRALLSAALEQEERELSAEAGFIVAAHRLRLAKGDAQP
jgi:hypothetical protein